MKAETKTSITAAVNGPYIVKELQNLSNKKGAIECNPMMALCRCGKSANKPYCDGAHAKNGFTSEKQDDRTVDKRDSYQGSVITIHDNRGVCAHAGACTDGLAAVFRLGQEPWIDPDAATVEDIISTIEKCPSGALSYTLGDVDMAEDLPAEPSIFIAPNGPYVVSGADGLLDDNKSDAALKTKMTLCRCGASKNKPFCDGSHWGAEFVDDKN